MSNRDIIVIGGSAGTTAALKEILSRLPNDLPAAVFPVLHIPLQGVEILTKAASNAARLPVHRGEQNGDQDGAHLPCQIITFRSSRIT
jgi:two-component system, chemotaxis family, protein-glutamate methylesterase/glutaminase